ncbi:MAG: hypothetical protein M3094_01845 [Actinomycetia bacterium]|nr:hypothetical protein [Actinomycetes bacterium]
MGGQKKDEPACGIEQWIEVQGGRQSDAGAMQGNLKEVEDADPLILQVPSTKYRRA